MDICIGVLLLNEMEWLPKWVEQHADWPQCSRIIFVEAADPLFAQQRPDRVTADGLSTDGSTEFLQSLVRSDSRFIHIKHGWITHDDPAESKTIARRRYLDVANELKPDFVAVIDPDEFYMKNDQQRINDILASTGEVPSMGLLAKKHPRHHCFPFTHIWRPESIQQEPLFKYEVVGGFWEMAHTKFFRWLPGVVYDNHQRPTYTRDGGCRLVIHPPESPHCIHMAFASDTDKRRAKHGYYKARGEGVSDRRRWYVDSRSAYEIWRPGDTLPKKAHIREYHGPIPECFQ